MSTAHALKQIIAGVQRLGRRQSPAERSLLSVVPVMSTVHPWNTELP